MLSCALIVLLYSQAVAQKQLPPEGGKPKDFSLPAKRTFTLGNGLGATLVPYGTIPKVTVSVVIRVGNANESPSQVWLADLMGEFLKEGTSTQSAQKIAQRAADMGGSIDVSVGPDQTFINGDVLSEFGPELVALLADIIRNPLFPASELARLKSDKIRQVSILRSDPEALTLERFSALMYPDHPYGRLFPTEAMIQGYTIDDVRAFYRANIGAARTHIYIAGKVATKTMEEAIQKAFAGFPRGPEPMINIPKAVSKREISIIDRAGAPQSTVYIGLAVIDPSHRDYRALLLANALLGGSFASRITSNIREDKGYTYSPHSAVSTRYRDAYWLQEASVTTSVTGPSLKEIFYEIDRLQGEPPSVEEVRGIQNYLAGVFVLVNSSLKGIINQLAFLNLHGLTESYLTDYVKSIYAVTPQEVQQITKTYLRDEDMRIVIAGDRKTIAEQVAPYGKIVN